MDDITRQAYWTEIRSLADDAIEAWRDGDVADRDGLYDWMHETADGHEWVIYTHCNYDVLKWSDNADAIDEMGGPGNNDDGMKFARMAYCAMEADLTAQIDAQWDDDEADMRDAIDEEDWRTVMEWAVGVDHDGNGDLLECAGLTRHDSLAAIREACVELEEASSD